MSSRRRPPSQALTLDAHLIHASKLPPEFQGQAVHLALERAGRLLLSAPIAGEMMTVCRDGDDLWGTPGSKIAVSRRRRAAPGDACPTRPGRKAEEEKEASRRALQRRGGHDGAAAIAHPGKGTGLPADPFRSGGRRQREQIGGLPCRVLDVRLMPQLAQSLHAEDWSARLWVGAD